MESFLDEDPIHALFSLILQDNPSQNALRDRACDAYIKKFPEDEKFEKAFAYTRKPHILFSHLLLITEEWECEDSYYKQMLDLFQSMKDLFIENPTESQSKIIEEFFEKIEF